MNKQNARIKRAFIYKSITSKVGAVSGENKISEILQLTSRFSVLYIYIYRRVRGRAREFSLEKLASICNSVGRGEGKTKYSVRTVI